MHLMYFCPGARKPDAWCSHAWDGKRPATREVTRGPSDTGGIIAAYPDLNADKVSAIGYFPEQQTWRRVAGVPVWIGYYNEAKPTEEELRRGRILPGHDVQLEGGLSLTIPCAREWDDGQRLQYYVKLPTAMDLDSRGKWVNGVVVPEYKRLWDIGVEYWDWLAKAAADKKEGDDSIVITVDNLCDMAAEVIATNYRVTKWELAALGAVTQEVAANVLGAVVDLDRFLAINEERKRRAGDKSANVKKKAQPTGSNANALSELAT